MHPRAIPASLAVAIALCASSMPVARADAPDPVASQRIAAARARANAIETSAFSVQTELRRARTRGDTPRSVCLDDLLTRMHVAARAARALSDRIAEASRTGDGAAAELDLVRLNHLGERTARLALEVQACVVGDGTSPRGAGDGTTRVRILAPPLPSADAYPAH